MSIGDGKQLKSYCRQIFRYAVATGRAGNDPTAPLKGALSKRKEKHLAAITGPKEVATMLRAIDAYKGTGRTAEDDAEVGRLPRRTGGWGEGATVQSGEW